MLMGAMQGLTESEARSRRERGLGNDTDTKSSRSYWDIARANLFTSFNNILFVIGVALIALGRYNDAVTSVGIGLANALIGTLQEIRAKRQLDRIALVSCPKVTVLREGREKDVAPGDVVEGDFMRVEAGDQVVVDGVMVGDGILEMDESLLTGEPDLIRKRAGDRLFSGSYGVTGTGYFEADKVGAASFANRLTATARNFQVVHTPLQRKVDFVVRVVMLVVAVMSVLILVAGLLEGLPTVRLVQIAAVLSGQVPYGLFLMVVVAYALGASAIAKQGALVQQINAVESLSNIDILCMDKTGTLTANRLVFEDVSPLHDTPVDEVRAQLGDFVRSAPSTNATNDAIIAGVPGEERSVADAVAFASARKWSALAFDGPERRGVYAMGAIEMLEPYLSPEDIASDAPLSWQARSWSSQGLRVLLFAHNPDVTILHDEGGEPMLPPLTPLAVIGLGDELRPAAKETIAAFEELGLELKVISGDNPHTVAALARRAGLPDDLRLVSGPELEAMDGDEFDRAAAENTVFGRIKPEQKERLVDALLRRDKRVAMMGDGVNDVPALKKASLGIAMQGGSGAGCGGYDPFGRLLRRVAPGVPRGAAHHRRIDKRPVSIPRAGCDDRHGHRRGNHGRTGLSLRSRSSSPDHVHRRYPLFLPDAVGASPTIGRGPFAVPGPVRLPRRHRDHADRDRYLRRGLQPTSGQPSHPGQDHSSPANIRVLYGSLFRERGLRRHRGDRRGPG